MGNFHVWGEKDFDWDGLYKAGELIYKTCKWVRLGIHLKEKWGTLRISPWFFDGSVHSLLYPGYVYCQYKFLRKIRWWLDIYFFPKLSSVTGLLYLIRKLQFFIYGYAYRKAIKKYPNLIEEILVDADYPELIGKVAIDIHNKYWKKVE